MSDPESEHDAETAEEIERARELILQRRNRFIAAALASLGTALTTTTCGPTVCLEPPTTTPWPQPQPAGTGGSSGREPPTDEDAGTQ